MARKAGSSIAVAVFLVDTGCLGVKSAFGRVMDAVNYAAFLDGFPESDKLVGAEAACVRRLVEGAVAYAADLGFSPDPDYPAARKLFGDLDASGCATAFEFGEDGEPLYVPGPDESPARIRAAMEKLAHRCGPDGFRFITAGPLNSDEDLFSS